MNTVLVTSMGAEAFMNHLDKLYCECVEAVNQQFHTYFASEKYAHIALLGEELNNMQRDTAKFASALEVYRSAIKSLPLLLFADGVEVDLTRHAGMDYGGENTAV